jgi:hypothetical protein
MKSVLGLVVAMMLVAPGCGDDTTSTTSNFDLSATPDLTAPTAGKDMTPPLATTCGGALACTSQSCFQSADPQTCAENCASALKGDQSTEFMALFTCVVTNSVVPADGGGFVFNPGGVVKTISPGGPCFQDYEACMGVGLDK